MRVAGWNEVDAHREHAVIPHAVRIEFTDNRLGLREQLQRYSDQQWAAIHLTPGQAAASME